ncbi:MAG: hypothetical protein ACI867_001189 [Glaciecola sp.]
MEQGGLYAELFNLQAAAYLAGSPPTEQATDHRSKP